MCRLLALPGSALAFAGTLPSSLMAPLRSRAGLLLIGAVAAALMLFGLDHIRHFAGKLANEAMPTVTATPEYLAYRELEVYRAAFEGLFADAQVSGKERATLERLRVKLGIQPADALALEGQIREEMGVGALGATG